MSEAEVDGPMSWPHDENGRPMAIVTGFVSDTVKAGENWIKIANTIMLPIPNGSAEDRINAARRVQREAEYIVGVERYLLNCELKGTVIPIHPETGERFAGVPNGYDPSSMPVHPADVSGQPGVVAKETKS